MKNQWDRIFKSKGKVFTKLYPDIEKIEKLFRKRGIKKILDLGCGTGRHLVYFSEKGFDVYGIDIARHGIKIAKNWLKKERLKANLKVGNIYRRLPYKDNFFDAIISIRVINHGTIQQIRKIIKEIERVLKPKGLIFTSFVKSKGKKERIWKYKILAPKTVVFLEGEEKGLAHYYFTRKSIRKEFKNFEISDIWIEYRDSRTATPHYVFLGELKYKTLK